jgi:hypothetical protein
MNNELKPGYYTYEVNSPSGISYTETKMIFVDLIGTFILTDDNEKQYINLTEIMKE